MKKKSIIYLVSFISFFGPFSMTIYTPMLLEVREYFHASELTVNLTISIYTLVLALMQIIYGPLVDTIGRRKVLIRGLILYIFGAVGAALSSSIYVLIAFRAIQAAGLASGSVVATTVIGDLFTGKMRGRAMGTFQMFVSLGPVLGPVIGGFLDFSNIFWYLSVLGILIWIITFFLLPETKPNEVGRRGFSIKGYLAILYNKVGFCILLLAFVQYYTFYNFLVFLPSILNNVYNLSTSQNGLVFLPLSLLIVVGSKIGGRIQENLNPHRFLFMSTFLNFISIVLFVFLAPVTLWLLISSISLFGLCLGLSLPIQTTMLTEIFEKSRGTAIGAYNFVRYMGMAAGPMIGALLLKIGNEAEFIFSAVLFAIAVVIINTKLISKKSNTLHFN